jgi:hypothetical protein
MDLFLIGVLLWFLIVAFVLLFVWGVWKKDWKMIMISGVFILVPSFIFGTAQGWVRLLLVLPLISFSLAYYTYRNG